MKRFKWDREDKERRMEPSGFMKAPRGFVIKSAQRGDHGGSISARVKASRKKSVPIALAGKHGVKTDEP